MARDLRVRIVGDAAGLQRAFGNASSAGSKWGSRMAKAGKVAAIGIGAGVAAIGIGLKKSVDAAIEAEKAESRLDAAFKAANITAKQRAQAMQTVSKVSQRAALDDEDLMDSLGRLARVTGDAAKAQRDLGIAANIARARGIELEAATKIVEKAELGQLGALKRIGIEIPKVTAAQDALKESNKKATAEQVKAAKAADEVATRQSAIAALQTQYAGAAEAYGKTAAGAQERFQVAVENLQESLGAKLLPVFTRVAEWATTHLPAAFDVAERAIDAVGPVFARVGQAAERAWPRVRAAAQSVVDWYRSDLKPTIDAVLTAIKGLWDKFGNDVLVVVKADLKVLRDAINTALALIRGDWEKAWRSLLPTVSGTFAAMKALMNLQSKAVAAAAEALGKAALDGITKGLAKLREVAAAKLREVPAAIRSFIGAVYSAAIQIGRALADGVIDGIGDIGGRILRAAAPGIYLAVKGLKRAAEIKSPSGLTSREIGQPLGEGVVHGWVLGSAPLPEKMKESVRKAIEAARAAVDASRGRLGEAWSALSSDVLSAFDAISGQIQTRSEKLLEKLRGERDKAAREAAVTEARNALTEAKTAVTGFKAEEGESPEDAAKRLAGLNKAVTDAQKQLDDALFAQREFALQQRIAQERREVDAKIAMRRRDLENALATLGESLSKQGVKAATASETVLKLMRRYGINFKKVGASMGAAWIAGLKETIEDAAKGAGALAGTVTKVAAGINVPGRAHGGPVTRGRAYMVGERGPELFVPNRSGMVVANAGGADGDIVIQLDGEVLARVNRRYAEKHARRNYGS